jgi:hypothetical protein
MTENKEYWQEVFRLLDQARLRSGDELLEKCLNGRPQTVQSVSQLFKIARLHFELEVKDRICAGCIPFLEPI